MQYVDICIGNEEDAEKVFGIKAPDTNVITGELSEEGYSYVCRELTERFEFLAVAITLRESISASQNNWSAVLYTGGEMFRSKNTPLPSLTASAAATALQGHLYMLSLMATIQRTRLNLLLRQALSSIQLREILIA